MASILEMTGLKVAFRDGKKELRVLHGVDLNVKEGEILGLVGESGSGKSLSCLAIMRLLGPNGTIRGSILFRGKEILSLPDEEMAKVRGRQIAMIFQDPIGALNPVKSIGKQIAEVIYVNVDERLKNRNVREHAAQLLGEVGIPDPKQRLKEYPHQLSGGQNQRVMIAMMLAGNPDLLIADEPTTALDVTIQSQILWLLKRLRDTRGMAIILVTHDLGVVAESCDRMAVMYCGRIVELGPVKEVFAAPRHPYTQGLLHSRPRVDQHKKALLPIKGVVPTPAELPKGCSFAPRCSFTQDDCQAHVPQLIVDGQGQGCACFHPLAGTKKGITDAASAI